MPLHLAFKLLKAIPTPRIAATGGSAGNVNIRQLLEFGKALVAHAVRSPRLPSRHILQRIFS